MDPVISVADARAGLSETLRRFRENPLSEPVVLGSHRRSEAALVPIAVFDQMRADAAPTPNVSLLDRLRRSRHVIQRLATLSNIRSVAVFGSVARGTETVTSDVDLLVEPTAEAGLFDLAQFAIDLEQVIGRPVDVVSRRSLRPDDDQRILAESVEL